jgi:ureidoacrylate peracid hydrolase
VVNIRLGAARNSWGVGPGLVDLRREPAPSSPVTVTARPQTLTLDLARTAIIVVDMQNDFCHPDGWLASIGVDVAPARTPIGPLRELLPWLRANHCAVVWLNWGNRPDRANLPPGVLHVYNPDGHCNGIGVPAHPGGSPTLQAGSWSAAIVDELKPEPDDISVDNYRMSGFFDRRGPDVLDHDDVPRRRLRRPGQARAARGDRRRGPRRAGQLDGSPVTGITVRGRL